MREYIVTIPIAGHVIVTVVAESEEAAIEAAWEAPESERELEWEFLESFNTGNVCHCPSPWRVEVEDNGEVQS